jgi:hypothetical protein
MFDKDWSLTGVLKALSDFSLEFKGEGINKPEKLRTEIWRARLREA